MSDAAPRTPASRDGFAQAGEVMNLLPHAVLTVEAEGTVVDANAAAETLFNLSRSAIIGVRIDDATGRHLGTMPAETPFVAYGLELALPGMRTVRADMMAAPLPDWPGWKRVWRGGRR